MTTHDRRTAGRKERIVLFFLLGILATTGCKDGSTPTGQTPQSYPQVAGHWVGIAREQRELTVNDYKEYQVTADLCQDAGTLGGAWVWTITRMSGGSKAVGAETRCRFMGSIDTRGNITILDTAVTFLNWSGLGWTRSGSLTAALSPRGDTIAGSDYGKISTISGNTFVIAKR